MCALQGPQTRTHLMFFLCVVCRGFAVRSSHPFIVFYTFLTSAVHGNEQYDILPCISFSKIKNLVLHSIIILSICPCPRSPVGDKFSHFGLLPSIIFFLFLEYLDDLEAAQRKAKAKRTVGEMTSVQVKVTVTSNTCIFFSRTAVEGEQ